MHKIRLLVDHVTTLLYYYFFLSRETNKSASGNSQRVCYQQTEMKFTTEKKNTKETEIFFELTSEKETKTCKPKFLSACLKEKSAGVRSQT